MGSDNLSRGVLLVIAAEAILVLSGILIRFLGESVPVAQLVFLRNALGLVFIVPLALRSGVSNLQTHRFHLHLLRALVGVSAMSCLYYGWTHLPLATAAMLKQTSPFFLPVLALWFLSERIPSRLRWTLPLGFAGVALVLQPTQTQLEWAMLVGLLGAVLGAAAKIVVRKMRDTEPSSRVVFYFTCLAALFSAPFAWLDWQPLSIQAWIGILAIGGLSTLAQLSMTQAYQSAPAGFLGPFTYSSVLIAALLGWWLFNETLSTLMLFGMLVIVTAGALTARAR